jgi:hypothetical protein
MAVDLHPDFPVVSGDYLLTTGWRVSLPEEFNRRVEDGSLVLWRPELTFWINAWNNDQQLTVEEQLNAILKNVSDDRNGEKIERTEAMVHLTYELAETDPDRAHSECHSISAYVIADRGYLQISAYYDSSAARTLGSQIIDSVTTMPVSVNFRQP